VSLSRTVFALTCFPLGLCYSASLLQSRLDAHGKDIGAFVLAAGQPDFAAFFGAANAQARACST
jgi:hypothetical protein